MFDGHQRVGAALHKQLSPKWCIWLVLCKCRLDYGLRREVSRETNISWFVDDLTWPVKLLLTYTKIVDFAANTAKVTIKTSLGGDCTSSKSWGWNLDSLNFQELCNGHVPLVFNYSPQQVYYLCVNCACIYLFCVSGSTSSIFWIWGWGGSMD